MVRVQEAMAMSCTNNIILPLSTPFLMILHSFFHIFCDIIPDIWGGIIVGLFKTDPSKITYSKPFKTRFEIPDLLLPTVKSNFPS